MGSLRTRVEVASTARREMRVVFIVVLVGWSGLWGDEVLFV